MKNCAVKSTAAIMMETEIDDNDSTLIYDEGGETEDEVEEEVGDENGEDLTYYRSTDGNIKTRFRPGKLT